MRIIGVKKCENTWQCELINIVECYTEGHTALVPGLGPQEAILMASPSIFLGIMQSSSQIPVTRKVLAYIGSHIFGE